MEMKGKLTTGEMITLGGAVAFLLSVFLFDWYKVTVSDLGLGIGGGEYRVGSRGGLTTIAILLAIVAIAEILARVVGGLKILPNPGQVHLIIAAVALVIVILRFFLKPSVPAIVSDIVSVKLGFGIFISLILAAVWTYGAYMMYSQPAAMVSGGDAPPATPPASEPGAPTAP
jgi:hypothetical protein